jgi:hypothetical protein
MSHYALEAAERHIQQEAHERQQACAREHRASWWVAVREANYSAFNGYHFTRSAYSECRCAHPDCGRRWRTNAGYVRDLPDEPPAEARDAYLAHITAHGCATPAPPGGRQLHGFGNCTEAARLWELLPADEKIAVAPEGGDHELQPQRVQ